MAEFSVKKIPLKTSGDELIRMANEMTIMQSEILIIANTLGFSMKSSGAFKARLRNISDNVGERKKSLRSMSDGLTVSVQKYQSTENRICSRAKTGGNIADVISSTFRFSEIMKKNVLKDWKDIGDFFQEIKANYKDKKWNEKLLFSIDTVYNFNKWVAQKKEELIEKTTVKAEAEASWKLWGADVKGEYGSAGVSVLAANAYAGASAGLFTTDKEGNTFFNPNIDAKAEASFTVLHTEAEGHIGNDKLGANAKGSVDVGSVGAKAEASFGVLNKDGEFDPRLKAELNAEAIAAEAKGEAGITVLGTEAKVKGSVNVGIGAHAKGGYKDGVLSLDVGLSVGVGASAAIEIDIGGKIKAVKDYAKSATKWFKIW